MMLASLTFALLGASLFAPQAPLPMESFPGGSKMTVMTSIAPKPVVGRFRNIDSTYVTVDVGERSAVSIPLRSVSDVKMSTGKNRRRGAYWGGAIGLALGAWFFLDTYPEIAEDDYLGLGALILGGISGLLAPAIGAGIGALVTPEGWRPVAVPAPSAQPARVVLTLPPQERVRVRTSSAKYSGRVVGNSDTFLTVADKNTNRIAWSDVADLQVSGGQNRRRGALLGAAALVAVGIYGETTEGATTSTGERIGAFTGAALVGAFLGARFLSGRGWISLPLPAR